MRNGYQFSVVREMVISFQLSESGFTGFSGLETLLGWQES